MVSGFCYFHHNYFEGVVVIFMLESANDEIISVIEEGRKSCFESNVIARSSWRVNNVWAQRVAAILISQISENDEELKEYDIPVTYIVTGNNRGSGSSFRLLRQDVAKTLAAQVAVLYSDNPKTRGNYTVYHVFKDGITYISATDSIRIGLNPALSEYYLALRKKLNFTVYLLQDFLKLRGSYTQTLFKYLKSWESVGEKIVSVKELHLLLNTTPSLKKSFTNFKRNVLDPAEKDINANTGLLYFYEPIKSPSGHKVTDIRFVFINKKPLISNESISIIQKSQALTTPIKGTYEIQESIESQLKKCEETIDSCSTRIDSLKKIKSRALDIKERFKQGQISEEDFMILMSHISNDIKQFVHGV